MDQPSWSRWLGSVQVVLSSKFTSLQLKRTKPNQHRTACLFGMTWHLKGGKYQISNRTAEEQQDIREKRTNRTTQVNSAPPSNPHLQPNLRWSTSSGWLGIYNGGHIWCRQQRTSRTSGRRGLSGLQVVDDQQEIRQQKTVRTSGCRGLEGHHPAEDWDNGILFFIMSNFVGNALTSMVQWLGQVEVALSTTGVGICSLVFWVIHWFFVRVRVICLQEMTDLIFCSFILL